MYLPRSLLPAGPLQGSGGLPDSTALIGIVLFCTPFLLFPLAKWYVDRRADDGGASLAELDGVPVAVTETLEPRLNERLSDLALTRTREDDAVVYRTEDGAEVGRVTTNGSGVVVQYRDDDGDLLDVPVGVGVSGGVRTAAITEGNTGEDGDVNLERLADRAAQRFRERHETLSKGEEATA